MRQTRRIITFIFLSQHRIWSKRLVTHFTILCLQTMTLFSKIPTTFHLSSYCRLGIDVNVFIARFFIAFIVYGFFHLIIVTLDNYLVKFWYFLQLVFDLETFLFLTFRSTPNNTSIVYDCLEKSWNLSIFSQMV